MLLLCFEEEETVELLYKQVSVVLLVRKLVEYFVLLSNGRITT